MSAAVVEVQSYVLGSLVVLMWFLLVAVASFDERSERTRWGLWALCLLSVSAVWVRYYVELNWSHP